ncbi:MAG TPA: WD40 repeat domain-containing serine/threonine-protein kinase, partial [Polyangiaceae bacterium]|nr:WD40 repeat domain-containing serine/threonine-protein kinase [Polyangiaceae bacterium]
AVLYTILAGKPPFAGNTLLALFHAVLNGTPEALRQVDPSIPADLAAIAERALVRDKNLRYQSARDLVDDLVAYQSGSRVNAYEYSSLELVQRFVARNRIAVLVSFTITVITVALLSDAWFRVVDARDRAVAAERRAHDNERHAERSLAEALTEKASAALGDGDSVAAELFAAKALTLEERADARGIVVAVTERLAPVPLRDQGALRGVTACVLSVAADRAACRARDGLALWAEERPGMLEHVTLGSAPVQLSSSRAGERLLVAHEAALALWDPDNKTEIRNFATQGAALTSAALAPNGRVAASADARGAIVVWDADTGRELNRLEAHETITSLAFSAQGDTLAAGARLGNLRIWRFRESKPARVLTGHEGTVLAVQFSPTGKYLASGASDRTLRIWETSTGAALGSAQESSGAVSALAWSPSSRYLAFASQDKALRLLDVTQRGAALQLRGHDSEISALGFSADSQRLAAVSSDLGLRWWSLAAPAVPFQLSESANVLSLAFAPSGELVSAGLGKYGVCLRRLPAPVCEARLPADIDQVRALAVSPNGKLLVVAGSGGRIFVWDVASRLPLHVFDAGRGELRSLAFSSDSRWLAAGGTDARVRVWDMARAEIHGTFDAASPVHSVVFRPGTGELVSAGRDGRVSFWDVAGRRATGSFEAHSDWIFSVAFSADGKWLVTGSADRRVNVWNAATRARQFSLVGHEGRVLSVAVSSKGQIVSAGEDASVRIWSLGDGRELAVLEGHDGPVRSVRISPSAALVASGSDDGTLRLWSLARLAEPAGALLVRAEQRHHGRINGMKLDFR